jgi:hypothetical protein
LSSYLSLESASQKLLSLQKLYKRPQLLSPCDLYAVKNAMKQIMKEWSEKLPEFCPPDDAFDPDGLTFYRLCDTVPITEGAFKSQRALNPSGEFKGVSECVARSLSVWNNLEDCTNILKLPRHRGKVTMKLELTTNDGLVLQTFKQNHFSWWRTQSFDITSVSIIQ